MEGMVNTFTLWAEWNSYYYTIRRAKRECWAAFLQGSHRILGDSEPCWKALRYTKPWASTTTPALKDPEGNMTTSLEDNAEMVGRVAFSRPPVDWVGLPPQQKSTAHQSVDESRVRRTLFDQSQKKAPGPDRLNFSMLQLLWK